MFAGFQAINTGNVIQIDQDYKNCRYLGKDILTVSNQGNGYGVINKSYSYNTVKFVAIRTDGNDPPIPWINVDRQSNTVLVSAWGVSGQTMTVYKYGYPQILNGNSFEVFNSSGELVFSDNMNPMRVLGFMWATVSAPEDYLNNYFYHDSSKVAAILPGSLIDGWYFGGGETCELEQQFIFNTNHIITTTFLSGNSEVMAVGYDYWWEFLMFSALVIDVTGL